MRNNIKNASPNFGKISSSFSSLYRFFMTTFLNDGIGYAFVTSAIKICMHISMCWNVALVESIQYICSE